MKSESCNTSTKETRFRRLLRSLSVVALVAVASISTPHLKGMTQAEPVTYCQLLKTPSTFDGRRIRITGVYLYSFETQRLLPSSCCEDRDRKTRIQFGDLDPKSRKLVQRFPKGTGMVLGTFVGKLDYGHSTNSEGAQITLTVTSVQNVARVAKGSEIKKAAWAPPLCTQ